MLLLFYHRVVGGSLAVSIPGYGAQRLPLFLLSEIGYGMEACLRGANTLRRGRLWRCHCLGTSAAEGRLRFFFRFKLKVRGNC